MRLGGRAFPGSQAIRRRKINNDWASWLWLLGCVCVCMCMHTHSHTLVPRMRVLLLSPPPPPMDVGVVQLLHRHEPGGPAQAVASGRNQSSLSRAPGVLGPHPLTLRGWAHRRLQTSRLQSLAGVQRVELAKTSPGMVPQKDFPLKRSVRNFFRAVFSPVTRDLDRLKKR